MFDPNTIYQNLIHLCDTTTEFYYSDQELDDSVYRIFNYRIASFTDFLLPDAMESRGIMYDITYNEPNLVSLPMRKFFNLGENPLTMDLSNPIRITEKADGSLISSYMHGNILKLKSKGSLKSDQAIAAMEWLDINENDKLYGYIEQMDKFGYTCNLEWVGPENRIVLGYPEEKLILLNVRSRINGEYLNIYDDKSGIYEEYGVGLISPENPAKFIENIPNMTDKIEGFVVEYKIHQFVKIKTDAYKVMHRSKDNVNTPGKLFEVVVDGLSDDLKTLFLDDPETLELIEEMERRVGFIYRELVEEVEHFYNKNKHLDRKDYAILGTKELKEIHGAFPCVMSMFLGKSVNYKELMKKNKKYYI